MEEMKLLIATPSCRDFKHGYLTSILALGLYLERTGAEVTFDILKNMSDAAAGRALITEKAIGNKFTHILFIDDDMQFNVDAAQILINRNVDFIGANCLLKSTNKTSARRGGEFVYSKNKTGIEKIDKIGMAFTLIKLSVFDKITRPFFESRTEYDLEKNIMRPCGEDTFLCNKASEAGIDIYVDHDAAKHVWHIWDDAHQES